MTDIRPSLIDRAIAAISPRRGAKQMADRAAYGVIAAAMTDAGGRIGKRSTYRAAQSNRRQTRNWRSKPSSANNDVVARQGDLIGRSRDAAMNFAPATAAIERNVGFTIGTGLMAIPDLDADALGLMPEEKAAWTARIMRDFDEYMSSTDPDAERAATGYGLQEVALRAMLESGDVLGLRCWPKDQPGRVHMTAWKLVEAERVASPNGHIEGTNLSSGAPCVGGVELDPYGAAQAYHVIQKAPPPMGQLQRRPNDTVRIPAWGESSLLPTALLVFDKRRPEQARGVPFLTPVLELVKVFMDATDAAALALVLQSMLAVVYKSPDATAMPEPEYGTGELVQSEGEPETLGGHRESDIAIEAGMVLELDDEASIDLVSPEARNPVYEKFFETMGTLIGAATGTPFGVLMARFNNSYTASKGEMELFYKEIVRRVERFAAGFCAPVFQCWLYEQVASGAYAMPGFLDDPKRRALWSSVRWAGDGKISLDPLREAKALEIHEQHAWQTGQTIAASINGGDYDANVSQRGREHQRFKEEGLPTPGVNGGGVAQPDGEARPSGAGASADESGDDE